MDPTTVPLDPDLFNPDIAGPSFPYPQPDPSAFYPPGDEAGWDSDQNNYDFETEDEESDHPLPNRSTDGTPHKSTHSASRLALSGTQAPEDQDDDEEEDEEDDDVGDDDESDQALGSSDLHRFIGAIRHRQPNQENTSHGILGEDWDRNMEQELNELREAEEALRPGKMRRSRMRGEPELSVEVSILLGKANLSFIEKDYEQAIPLFEEIVRIEPMCKMAWNNLGAIYQEMGNFERSSQFRIIGAHLTVKAAEAWKELASESRQHGLLSQAIYCYSEAIKAGKDDVESMWDRSFLLFELGRPRQALAGYLSILKISPHNPDVLREVAHLCATTDEKEQPIKLFKEALKYYQSAMPSPSEDWLLANGFGLEHILILIRLLMKLRAPAMNHAAGLDTGTTVEREEQGYEHYYETLRLIKQAIRWLQGRLDAQHGAFLDWDALDDDREFDPVRRTREDWETITDPRFESSPPFPLDNELRTYLGVCRLMVADEEEAAFHFDLIKKSGAHSNAEFCMTIGDAYFQCNQWEEALEFYHDLAENESTNNPILWHKIGRCYRNGGNFDGALECFEAISETDPVDLNARIQLVEIYEQLGHRQKALDMVNELIELRRKARESGIGLESDAVLAGTSRGLLHGPHPTKSGNVLAARGTSGQKPLAERRLDEELLASKYVKTFEKLEALSGKLCSLSSKYSANKVLLMAEYVRLASPLVEGFRQTSALFPCDLSVKFSGSNLVASQASGKRTENNPEEMAQSDIGQEFRRIRFTNWVRIFVYLNRADEACEVLDHVMRAPTFRQSASMQQVLRLAYAACCYAKEDYVAVVETIRWLARILVFHNDPIRLISALLSQGFQASIAFFNTNTQKWLLRQLQLIDACVSGLPVRAGRASVPVGYLHNNDDDDDDDDEEEEEEEEKTGSNELETGGHSNQTKKVGNKDKTKKKKKKKKQGKVKPRMMDQTKLLRGHQDQEDEEDDSYWKPSKFKPTKINPVFIVTFAQILAGTRSFKSSIVYLLRLHEFYPNEPLLSFSLAVSYVQRAMQRQTDNRHHQIVEGLAFFDQYRKSRGNEFNQEVEFNLGRIYHGLGLVSLAITHYNRVLALAPKPSSTDQTSAPNNGPTPSSPTGKGNGNEKTDLANLSAYNLILIYSTAGSPDLAHQLSRQYLTV